MARCWNSYVLFIVMTSLSLAACNRMGTNPNSMSTITIQAPKHLLAQVPSGQVACYAINIYGGNLVTSSGGSCGPDMGITAGYVTSGQTVSATVPMNQTITIDLYMYLEPVGTNKPCPGFSFSSTLLPNTYFIGEASNVLTNSAQVDVNITANYTGQSVVQTMRLPASCTAGASGPVPPSHYSIDAGGVQTSTATGLKLNARVGAPTKTGTLTGTGYKLTIW